MCAYVRMCVCACVTALRRVDHASILPRFITSRYWAECVCRFGGVPWFMRSRIQIRYFPCAVPMVSFLKKDGSVAVSRLTG